jgi:hypothetical protein
LSWQNSGVAVDDFSVNDFVVIGAASILARS